MHTKRILVVRVFELRLEEVIDELPRPPRVPDVAREYAAAIVRCAPGFRSSRHTSTGSTLRLVRESEAA